MSTKKKILILGQTPPPFGGQALMIQTLLEPSYANARLFHVRLDFSKNFDEMGTFKLYKFWALGKAIVLTWAMRFYHKIDAIYYGPAGPNKMAMYRDVLLLGSTRFLFKKLILHTHAGGSSSLYERLGPVMKLFYRAAFFRPDVLITITEFSHGEEKILQPKKIRVVPNGIKDEFAAMESKKREDRRSGCVNLLYAGAMYRERGILELIEAAAVLNKKGHLFKLNLMGLFMSEDFQNEVLSLIKGHGLENKVFCIGTKVDGDKWEVFKETDIFCFPTYVPSETFGLVLIESMQFKIPVVATRWNGIPFVVDDGDNGLLVKPMNYKELAEKIELLMKNQELRRELGENGRNKYLHKYTVEKFWSNMDTIFDEL